jgi:hypothetical protein
MLQYRLTEDNLLYGIEGLMLTREQYIAIPYYDRCLFLVEPPDHTFLFQVEFSHRRKNKIFYKFYTLEEVLDFLDKKDLGHKKTEVKYSLSRDKDHYINSELSQYTFKCLLI